MGPARPGPAPAAGRATGRNRRGSPDHRGQAPRFVRQKRIQFIRTGSGATACPPIPSRCWPAAPSKGCSPGLPLSSLLSSAAHSVRRPAL